MTVRYFCFLYTIIFFGGSIKSAPGKMYCKINQQRYKIKCFNYFR